MDTSSFDFNIENYTLHDLERYLNLDDVYGYDEQDINNKVDEFKKKINTIPDTNLKNKLTNFIGKVKDKLLNVDQKLNNFDDLNPKSPKNNIISAGSTYIIDNFKNKNKNTSSNVQQVYLTDVAKGNIQSIKRKTTTSTFVINSLFRNEKSLSSTDFIYYLPYQLNNVSSMELIGVILPQSIYRFSEFNLSNTIYIKEYSDPDPSNYLEGLVILTPGNYKTNGSTPDLATTLTTLINTQLGTGTRFTVTINPINYKTTITNSTYNFDMYIIYPGTNRVISETMGWILGFRSPIYINQLSYTSESIFNITPAPYLYIEVNDFNSQQRASQVLGLFNDSYLDNNLLGKLDYIRETNYTNYEYITLEGHYIHGGKREYFGPVHLQKLYIRLLNQYGSVVDLNGLDFTITLELKIFQEL